MTASRNCFNSFNPDEKSFVLLADEVEVVQVKDKGSDIKVPIDKDTKLSSKLLSVNKLANDDYKVSFENDCCRIIKDGVVKVFAKASSNLYLLPTIESACTIKEKEHDESCQHTWHKRFGHRNIDAIKQLENGLVPGIKTRDCGIREICECCMKGKMTKKPFPKESLRGRVIFWVSYIRIIYLMKTKDGTTKCVKGFVQLMKNQLNKIPKVIRSDRRKEYVSNNLRSYLHNAGIKIQYTAGYSLQKYWGEAIHTANLQNILSTKHTGKTPYESWYSELPDVKNLRSFGTMEYVHIPQECRRKIDEKAEKLRFVEYSEESKAHRLLNTTTDKLKKTEEITIRKLLKKKDEPKDKDKENKVTSKDIPDSEPRPVNWLIKTMF
ncbi:uncharacterized protein LOC117151740 [Bombus impatiens]|uniref:Uncharacterized protein LOC117151740 n=1 Tax=Bombus impatiens TaxID=132113 RepID=A0A6P8LQE1_BOMIM|nr:uncharacterized protein LOC117151740 [Bombus impatiens]